MVEYKYSPLSMALRLERFKNAIMNTDEHLQAEIRRDPYRHICEMTDYMLKHYNADEEKIRDLQNRCAGMKDTSIDQLLKEDFDVKKIVDNLSDIRKESI